MNVDREVLENLTNHTVLQDIVPTRGTVAKAASQTNRSGVIKYLQYYNIVAIKPLGYFLLSLFE